MSADKYDSDNKVADKPPTQDIPINNVPLWVFLAAIMVGLAQTIAFIYLKTP